MKKRKHYRFLEQMRKYGDKPHVRAKKLNLTKYEESTLLHNNFVKCSQIKDKRKLCRVLKINRSHIEGLNHINGDFIRDYLYIEMSEKLYYNKLIRSNVVSPVRWIHIDELTFEENIRL